MIASTIVAAALASSNPAQATAPAPAHDHAAMIAGDKAMAGAKMDCCKDGCACCAKKDGPAEGTKPAR